MISSSPPFKVNFFPFICYQSGVSTILMGPALAGSGSLLELAAIGSVGFGEAAAPSHRSLPCSSACYPNLVVQTQ